MQLDFGILLHLVVLLHALSSRMGLTRYMYCHQLIIIMKRTNRMLHVLRTQVEIVYVATMQRIECFQSCGGVDLGILPVLKMNKCKQKK